MVIQHIHTLHIRTHTPAVLMRIHTAPTRMHIPTHTLTRMSDIGADTTAVTIVHIRITITATIRTVMLIAADTAIAVGTVTGAATVTAAPTVTAVVTDIGMV